MENKFDRRSFLSFGIRFSASALALGAFMPKAVAAAACGSVTPDQVEGPFYPGATQFTPINDLTVLAGAKGRPLGQIAYLSGVVQDQHCRPIEGVNVEIWQACASGRYNSAKDDNPAPLDPNFRYWGEAFTNARGEYEFKTIVPGAYPNDPSWTRPAHIHFKVSKKGFHELTTQMYFKGDPYNDRDLILQKLPKAEQEKVVVEFKPVLDRDQGSVAGRFDIVLKSVCYSFKVYTEAQAG